MSAVTTFFAAATLLSAPAGEPAIPAGAPADQLAVVAAPALDAGPAEVDTAPVTIVAADSDAEPEVRVLTIEEALASTRNNNITWASLGELENIADAGRDIGIALFLPKVMAEGQWLHMGEQLNFRMDTSSFENQAMLMGLLGGAATSMLPDGDPTRVAIEEAMAGMQGGGDLFGGLIPPLDTVTGTFSLVVPVINPTAIPLTQGAYDRYEAAVKQIEYGRESLLYGVAKVYYGLLTMQEMLEVSNRSIEAAVEHYRSTKIRADLQAATRLDVRRAELEVTKAESQKIQLLSQLESAKSGFRYLAGLTGPFGVVDPELHLDSAEHDAGAWLDIAKRERQDLAAAKTEVMAAEHDVMGIWTKYLPSLNLIGSVRADSSQQERYFIDHPFSWSVVGALKMDVWDGGIREAEMKMKKATLRQAELKVVDLERQIENTLSSALRALNDATVVRRLAERQLEVALDTQKLIKVSEKAGAVTGLEVIDVNTMVFASEASLLSARLTEAMAFLDLLAAAGSPVPFGS